MEAPVVQLDTTMGPVTVELYYKHSPKASRGKTVLLQSVTRLVYQVLQINHIHNVNPSVC